MTRLMLCISLLLLAGLALANMPAQRAMAADPPQHIVIDWDVGNNHVYGNGDPSINDGSSFGLRNSNNNSVTINSGGRVGQNVIGGFKNPFLDTDVIGNSVVINGGSVAGIVAGGYTTNSKDVSGNSVVISGGSVGQHVYGGYTTGSGNAVGNSVVISGGKMLDIYGGWSENGSATGNTVTLSGTPDLSRSRIYGGGPKLGMDKFTGNTLNVNGFRGPVVGLANFENYNFLPSPFFAPGMAQVHITGAETVDLSNTNITWSGGKIAGSGAGFAPGMSVKLIDKVEGVPDKMTVGNPVVHQGITLIYTFDLALQGNALVAVATSVHVAPETKSLSEGRLASLAFNKQGADHVAGKGMKAAYDSVNIAGANFSAFASLEGGASTYPDNSHVDVSGASLITGIAWKPQAGHGKFLLAPFFEAGWGGYDTYNSFSGNTVKGKGNIEYYGGGLLLRFDLPANLYFEASGRGGGVRTDYSSSDLRDLYNRKAEYDISAAYYGAHAGLGYIWNFNEKADLDIYAKYFWTGQNGSTGKVCGDKIKFKAMDSHRLRGGTRFSYAVNDYITPYVGAAYEHEFDGRARASVYGNKISTPDLIGGTGMGELGLNLKPSKDLSLSFDLGAQGYVGKRQGVTGSLQGKFEF